MEIVEPNSKRYLMSVEVPDDPYYSMQWHLQNINLKESWNKISHANKQIVVGVIDTGIESSHEDLSNRIVPGGYSFIFNNSKVDDVEGHGTAVAGVISAAANNHKGIVGIAGTLDVKILPLQAFDNHGEAKTSDIVRAINYAIEQQVDVINMSFGSLNSSEIENQAIQNAINQGIIVIASAGNDGNNSFNYPASYENVISVGSISRKGSISVFSNYNNQVDLVAPGEDVFTTSLSNSYNFWDGTSFSAPVVTGIAALLKAINPQLDSKDILDILSETAKDLGPIGKDKIYGYGLVNADEAVNYLIGINQFEQPTEFAAKYNVTPNKIWEVKFNMPLNPQTINDNNIIISKGNNLVDITVEPGEDNQTIIIRPPVDGYVKGQTYTLLIKKDIMSLNGKTLSKAVKMNFTIEP